MMALAARTFERVLGLSPRDVGTSLLYDVCHNVAKMETHRIDGRDEKVCVHRKGATRAFGPRHREIPAAYRDLGQPVLIPGDMGRGSDALVGADPALMGEFRPTRTGAGRQIA